MSQTAAGSVPAGIFHLREESDISWLNPKRTNKHIQSVGLEKSFFSNMTAEDPIVFRRSSDWVPSSVHMTAARVVMWLLSSKIKLLTNSKLEVQEEKDSLHKEVPSHLWLFPLKNVKLLLHRTRSGTVSMTSFFMLWQKNSFTAQNRISTCNLHFRFNVYTHALYCSVSVYIYPTQYQWNHVSEQSSRMRSFTFASSGGFGPQSVQLPESGEQCLPERTASPSRRASLERCVS